MRTTTTSTSRGPSSSRRFPILRDPKPPQAPSEDHQESDDEEGGFFKGANTATDNLMPQPRYEEVPASSSRTPKPESRLWKARLRESIAEPPGGRQGGGSLGADQPPNRQLLNAQGQRDIFRFAMKIKFSDVPTWDGNGDTILDWLDDLNLIANLSQSVYNDLGLIAPLRLTDAAKRWFNALDPPQQRCAQQNWGSFKLAVSAYFMNPQWFSRMTARTLLMRYRQKGHEQELPSDYFHRKVRMIKAVFVQTPSETVMEIMNSAPPHWSILIDTSRINTIAELQYSIKYHEEQLVRDPETQRHDLKKRIKAVESRLYQ